MYNINTYIHIDTYIYISAYISVYISVNRSYPFTNRILVHNGALALN